MSSDHEPIDSEHADPQPVASLQLDDVQLPIYDLADFNAADVRRVSSFVTNFGSWTLPADVATALASADGMGALEWIHDTGELVLLGGVPTEGEVFPKASLEAPARLPACPRSWAGIAAEYARRRDWGMVREYFRSEVMPPGSRVALLAHVAHGPQVHELLWGWHREHRSDTGWSWLVERLARLQDESGGSNHLA